MCVGEDVASLKKGLTLLLVTRLPFGSKLWRLFSSTMPHPTWFYNTQLGMIHETQAFVQVVMLVWSWSWFVTILYLRSNVILVKKFNDLWPCSYVGVGDVAAVDDCWCRWQLRRSWVPGHQDVILMFTFSFYSKKSESEMLKYFFLQLRASRRHLDVYIVVLQQEIWIGNVEDSFVDSSGAQSSRCPPFAHFRIWSCL